ncbi:MAG: hypothetical protein Q8L48_08150 [Archangium sp.]|nr:hypothetical protein [Archangium sp.]
MTRWRMQVLWAVTLTAGTGWAQTAPIVPRPKATGYSTIEQRYSYAPPDKGEIVIPLGIGGGAPTETILEEPIMCSPQARAKVTIKYDKSKNEVKFVADFHKALPYRMSHTRPDVSTPYNQFPTSVQDGKWQMWFVTRLLSFETNFYYDAATLQLIGNEAEFPGGPPPNSFPISVPTLHMVCSPIFEGEPDGDAHLEVTYRYDQILDDRGAGGTYAAFLPYNLCKPDQYGVYYVNGGLPVSKAPNFDQVLQSIWEGYGMAISSSLEPDPKPAYLNSRDNTMIGWGGAYPIGVPDGIVSDPISGLLRNRTTCGTHEAPAFPPAYFNVCGP